jgi:hypothetical protein
MDSLTSKTNEIDEADDRAMELNKEIKRLKKRADKLDRQNRTLTSELEELKAKAAAIPMAPPAAHAAGTPRAAASGTPATTHARSPASGLKRRRDEDDQPARPAEARVQPGPALKSRSPFPRDENTAKTTPSAARPMRPTSAKSSDRVLSSTKARSPHPPAERKLLGAKNVFAQQQENVN